jgi:alkylation response protein AidB-like acyl-CoA dehydrogenase
MFEEEHEWFRQSAKEFVRREFTHRQEEHRAANAFDRDIWHRAGSAGFLGLGIPAEHGGSGTQDFRFNTVLDEELARASLAYASAISIHVDVVTPYLVELSAGSRRGRWLAGAASGDIVTAIAMTEPGAGSDLLGMRTRGRRTCDGWVLNGSKTFITNGATADLVVVAARTDEGTDSPALTLFGVEAGAPGFKKGRKLQKVGQHESDTAELFFEDVILTDDDVLGEVNAGFGHLIDRLPQERLAAACINIAHAQSAFELTLAYVKERQAFGRPIGTFQHNRFVLADLATRLDVTQTFVDRCVEEHNAGELSPVDAAKAKWWAADIQNTVIDACVQLHGGYGYMLEYDIARAWTDARITRIWAGSNEIMKEIIGRSLGLGDPRS